MKAVGAPAPDQAVLDALSQINVQLVAIEQELGAVTGVTLDTNYTTKYTTIQPFCDAVDYVAGEQAQAAGKLAHARASSTAPEQKDDDLSSAAEHLQNAERRIRALPDDALVTFHNALMDTQLQPIGLIHSYSQQVVNSNPTFYSILEARKVEAWWQRLDAVHAALLHLMIQRETLLRADKGQTVSQGYINDMIESTSEPKTGFLPDRYAELKALRGMVTATDTLAVGGPFGTRVTGVNYVPDGYTYQHGAPLLWSSRGEIFWCGPTWTDPLAEDRAAQLASMTLQGRPIYMWRRPTEAELKTMLDWDTSHDVIARLVRGNFRHFDGMGIGAANATMPTRPSIPERYGPGPKFTRLQDQAMAAVYMDKGGSPQWDWDMRDHGDYRACVQFYVSPYDKAAEPHWYEP